MTQRTLRGYVRFAPNSGIRVFQVRSIEDVVAILEEAFRPLECVAELADYDHKLGFRVYLPDGEFVTFLPMPVDQLRSGPGLRTVIEAMRSKVQQKGVELRDWALQDP